MGRHNLTTLRRIQSCIHIPIRTRVHTHTFLTAPGFYPGYGYVPSDYGYYSAYYGGGYGYPNGYYDDGYLFTVLITTDCCASPLMLEAAHANLISPSA